jgi:hypothetical protein
MTLTAIPYSLVTTAALVLASSSCVSLGDLTSQNDSGTTGLADGATLEAAVRHPTDSGAAPRDAGAALHERDTGVSSIGTEGGAGPGEVSASCGASPVYADNFTAPTAPGAGYTTINGTWTRAIGSYTAVYPTMPDSGRAYALIAGDYTDFDITIEGHSIGGDGFGLVYATTGIGDGFAVLVHPKQYQGLYIKQLVPNQDDISLNWTTLPTLPANAPFKLRVQQSSGNVSVTLSGSALTAPITISGQPASGAPTHGSLGLVLSPTTDLHGAMFTDFDVSSATCFSSGVTDAGTAVDATATPDTGTAQDAGMVTWVQTPPCIHVAA